MQTFLSKNEINEVFEVRPNEGKVFWKKAKQHPEFTGKEAGALNKINRWVIGYKNKDILRYHIIYCYVTGIWPDFEIDHINRDCSDDRIENLRKATRSQNMMNQITREKKSNLPRGCCLLKNSKKIQAQITINYKSIYLGLFDTIQEASEAYQKARIKYFGEFA